MKAGARRYDIDWLRTLASYLVVVYHTAQFFDFQQKTYVKNGQLSWSMDIFTQFVHIWHMPLFFLLAGWSSKSSLSSRGAWRFLAERAQRLLIPLVFGLVILCAPPGWVALKHGLFKTSSGQRLPAQPTISFTTFLQEYHYTGEGMSWNHLWFLAYLFTFTLLYLPGFVVLSKLDGAEKWTHGWVGWVLGNFPVIPLAVVQVTLRDCWPGYQNLTDDWANFCYYSIFFITGFCLAQYPELEACLHGNWKANLPIGILSCLSSPFLLSLGAFQYRSFLKHICSALGAWYMVLFFLSYAQHNFCGREPPSFWVRHAFPVYVVHDLFLSLLADILLSSWESPIIVKFVTLAGSALLLTLVFVPRDHAFLCVLVGMRKESRSDTSCEKVD